MFLRCAYESHRLHKKVKNVCGGPTPGQAKTFETPTKPGDQYINEIVVLPLSIRATDHEAVLGFGGAAASAIVYVVDLATSVPYLKTIVVHMLYVVCGGFWSMD